MLRLVVPLIAGICAGLCFDLTESFARISLIVLILLLIPARLFPVIIRSYSLRVVPGVFYNLFLFYSGFILPHVKAPGADAILYDPTNSGTVLARVAEPPTVTGSSIKTVLRFDYKYKDGQWERCRGKVLAYLKVKPGSGDPGYGERVLLRSPVYKIRDNSNPYSFNYARYLFRKGISDRTYADTWQWQKSSHPLQWGIRKFAFHLREQLLEILKQNKVAGDSYAVAAALLLGYVSDLSPELLHDYAASGAMHVLSVSGMHVGVIYLFIELLLGFMNKNRWSRWLKTAMILLLIWFYACMTGLSPCVVRSAIMITLPIIARAVDRTPDMYNVIAASLFIMLVIDPNVLFDVGFQLSYLAVTGLVVLYKPIYDLYVTSAWLPDKIWSLWAVSIAAQISTLPVALYVFHQFPNYFLLTNLLVVPLSSLIIYTGILLISVAMIGWLAIFVAQMLVYLITFLNTSIHFIEGLPWSTLSGIFISESTMVLLFLLIITGYLFFKEKKIHYLYVFLLVIATMAGFSLVTKINKLHETGFTVFNARKFSLISFFHHDRAIVIYGATRGEDATLLERNRKMIADNMRGRGVRIHRLYWLKPIMEGGLTGKGFMPVQCRSGFLQFGEKKILVLNKMIPNSLKHKIKVDFVVLTGNPRVELVEIRRLFSPEIIIMDGTNSRYRIEKWNQESIDQSIKIHSVSMQGAYERKFEKD